MRGHTRRHSVGLMPDRPDRGDPPRERSMSARRLQALLVLAACASLIIPAGCESGDEPLTAKRVSVRPATSSRDLASRVVEGSELVGYRLVADDSNEVETDPGL